MPVELTIVETELELGQTTATVILESASEPGPAGPGVPVGGTDGQVLTKTSSTDYATAWEDATGGGGGAPADAGYLVTASDPTLSAEVVVGATPGGELGGTWGSPTVDTIHSGSSHAATQAAAEATAAGALAAHEADTTNIHGIVDTSALALTANVPSNATFNDHSARHEDGGADEISIAGLSGTSAALQAHLDDTSDAHDASAISSVAAGNLAATDVQAALNELDTEKAAAARSLTAGAGLAGGGDLSADRTFSVNVDDSTVEINADTLRVKDSGITSAKIADGAIVNADVNASAAIAYSKLALTGSIVAGDISDAELAAIAGLTSAADRLPYFTGSGTASLATFTSAGRALVDDADAAAQRATLSVYSQAEVATELADQKRVMEILVSDPNGSAITTGDGKAYVMIPVLLNGHNLVAVLAAVTTQSSSGIPTVQIANVTQAADMLTTKLTIDANESTSLTAANAAVIDTGNDDVASGDILRIDIDVAGTGAKGLMVALTFEAP